jgi:N-methylhydantoinase B
MTAVCDEMGAVLRRAAFSPNIKDRLDYSCAIFDHNGDLCAQAAHIPVHLGSMAYAMRDIVTRVDWEPNDMVILNDPYLGGTHLPDITLIAPVFAEDQLVAFVANRAHHADIGASAPGSMPLSSRLDEEGVIIPPGKLFNHGELDKAFFESITSSMGNVEHARGDFAAQISANRTGRQRLLELINDGGVQQFNTGLQALNEYGERLARAALQNIPDGEYAFQDVLDDDGQGQENIGIAVRITIAGSDINVNFTGTEQQVSGNLNCPLSVAAAAVYYVFRCLMPDTTPACAGAFKPIAISAPEGCLVNAQRPAAVAAGNVETSTRIVDVVMGALAQAIPQIMPAASHGSMNNLAMGSRIGPRKWDYYETIGGGMGASSTSHGLSAVQTHMTNTLNTPIESLEMHYPLRVVRYAVRYGSGGQGVYNGGDGLQREIEFLENTEVTLLTERRNNAPWGMQHGEAGKTGRNTLNDQILGGKVSFCALQHSRLRVETPGGGGWGALPEK